MVAEAQRERLGERAIDDRRRAVGNRGETQRALVQLVDHLLIDERIPHEAFLGQVFLDLVVFSWTASKGISATTSQYCTKVGVQWQIKQTYFI